MEGGTNGVGGGVRDDKGFTDDDDDDDDDDEDVVATKNVAIAPSLLTISFNRCCISSLWASC